jgi:CRP/FNR family cyclic AMP-dependent transcriptional regulator
MKGLVERLRQANRQIESLALLNVYGRVLRLLLDLSEHVNGELVIQKAPYKQEMAYMVGASREMVSRVMKWLQDSGHIREYGRRIVLFETAAGDSHSTSRIKEPSRKKGEGKALFRERAMADV